MVTLSDVEDILQSHDGKVFSFHKLLDLGVTKYSLEKLQSEGKVAKVSHGKYAITLKKESRTHNKEFKHFYDLLKYNIVYRNYGNAYKILIQMSTLKTDYKFEQSTYIMLLLLKNIIGDGYDFSLLDKMTLSIDYNHTASYQYNFIEFKKHLLNGDMIKAYNSLELYMADEKTINDQNSVTTFLFSCLLEEILTRKKLAKETTNYQEIFLMFSKFKEFLNAKDYEQALGFVKKITLYIDGAYLANFTRIQKLLETIIACQDGCKLPEFNLDYSFYKTPLEIFYAALDKKDYITAYNYINHITVQNGSVLSEIIVMLLSEVKNLNFRKLKSNKQKNYHGDLNDELISELVYNREYSYLRNLIVDKKGCVEDLTPLEVNMLNLIDALNTIKEKGHTKRYFNYDTISDDLKFAKALEIKDYVTAHELVRITFKENIQGQTRDVYAMILDDIVDAINEYEHKSKANSLIAEIDKNSTELIHDNLDNIEKILAYLEDLLVKKCVLLNELNTSTVIEEILIMLIQIIKACKDEMVNIDYIKTVFADGLLEDCYLEKEELLIVRILLNYLERVINETKKTAVSKKMLKEIVRLKKVFYSNDIEVATAM